jgi:hypothetical protein
MDDADGGRRGLQLEAADGAGELADLGAWRDAFA